MPTYYSNFGEAAGAAMAHNARMAAEHATARTSEERLMPDNTPTTRNGLAALLAHHADVLAARWYAVAPGPGAWEVAAALALRDHASDLTAEEETPFVREFLDSVLAFEADEEARQVLGTTDQQPATADRRDRIADGQGEPAELRDLPREVRILVHAIDRMLSDWAESGDDRRADLWQGVHEANSAVWNRPLTVLPAPVDRAAVLRDAVDALAAERDVIGHAQAAAYGMERVVRLPRRLADEAQPECAGSVSGSCLAETQSDGACDTESGECVHGGRPTDEAQPATDQHEHTWVTALDGDDLPALDETGHTWTHCGTCGTKRTPDERREPHPTEADMAHALTLLNHRPATDQPDTETEAPRLPWSDLLGVAPDITGGACTQCYMDRARDRDHDMSPEHAHCRTVLDELDTAP